MIVPRTESAPGSFVPGSKAPDEKYLMMALATMSRLGRLGDKSPQEPAGARNLSDPAPAPEPA